MSSSDPFLDHMARLHERQTRAELALEQVTKSVDRLLQLERAANDELGTTANQAKWRASVDETLAKIAEAQEAAEEAKRQIAALKADREREAADRERQQQAEEKAAEELEQYKKRVDTIWLVLKVAGAVVGGGGSIGTAIWQIIENAG